MTLLSELPGDSAARFPVYGVRWSSARPSSPHQRPTPSSHLVFRSSSVVRNRGRLTLPDCTSPKATAQDFGLPSLAIQFRM